MSYKPEVQVPGSDAWSGNALRFATEDEAQAYVLDLAMRWTAVRDVRVVPSDDPVNYRVSNGRLEQVTPAQQPQSRDRRNASAEPTPGPWRVEGTQQGLFIAGSEPGYLAEIRDCGSGDVSANATMIAAAPETLDALLDLVRHFSALPLMDADREALAKALAAIAKAEGRS